MKQSCPGLGQILYRCIFCLAIVAALPGITQAQPYAILTVDCDPGVSPGGGTTTMGMAVTQCDSATNFIVTEVTPEDFRLMTALELSAFDAIAVNNYPSRLGDSCVSGAGGGLGTTWHDAVGETSGGCVVLTSHDAPRFHVAFMPFSTPMSAACPGCEPFGACQFVEQAVEFAASGPQTGLVIFNDDPSAVGGLGWDNPELNLPAAWNISDLPQFGGVPPNGGYTEITAGFVGHPMYAGLSDVRLTPSSISSFAHPFADGSFHTIFNTFDDVIFDKSEQVINATVVNPGNPPGCCFGTDADGPDGQAITLIRGCAALPDDDGDGVPNSADNCPQTSNSGQEDADVDDVGDVCDNCPADPNTDQADGDGDDVGDVCDNCPGQANSNQVNVDGDDFGAACDCNDGDPAVNLDATEVCDAIDNNCDGEVNEGFSGILETCNGVDDNCNGDVDEGNPDGGAACFVGTQPPGSPCFFGEERCITGFVACFQTVFPGGAEICDNGIDDDCDGLQDEGFDINDSDGDGILNCVDNCVLAANPPSDCSNPLGEQCDDDGDGLGDACDCSPAPAEVDNTVMMARGPVDTEIHWSAVPGVDEYHVYRGYDGPGSNLICDGGVNDGATCTLATELTNCGVGISCIDPRTYICFYAEEGLPCTLATEVADCGTAMMCVASMCHDPIPDNNGGPCTEILSRVVYDALVQAASFLTPSSNTTPVMTSARSFAPFSALHRF